MYDFNIYKYIGYMCFKHKRNDHTYMESQHIIFHMSFRFYNPHELRQFFVYIRNFHKEFRIDYFVYK